MSALQRLREGIVAILDQAPALAALTGRNRDNVLPALQAAPTEPFEEREVPALPVVTYGVAELPRRAQSQVFMLGLSAWAATEADANNLLDAIEDLLTVQAFAGLSPTMDAYAIRNEGVRAPGGFDPETHVVRVDLDLPVEVLR